MKIVVAERQDEADALDTAADIDDGVIEGTAVALPETSAPAETQAATPEVTTAEPPAAEPTPPANQTPPAGAGQGAA